MYRPFHPGLGNQSKFVSLHLLSSDDNDSDSCSGSDTEYSYSDGVQNAFNDESTEENNTASFLLLTLRNHLVPY